MYHHGPCCAVPRRCVLTLDVLLQASPGQSVELPWRSWLWQEKLMATWIARISGPSNFQDMGEGCFCPIGMSGFPLWSSQCLSWGVCPPPVRKSGRQKRSRIPSLYAVDCFDRSPSNSLEAKAVAMLTKGPERLTTPKLGWCGSERQVSLCYLAVVLLG